MYERRLLRMFFAIAALLAVVLGRAFWVQVVSADEILRKNERVLRSTAVKPALRGEILWSDGTPAVRNTSRWAVRLDLRKFFGERSRCDACGEVLTRPAKLQKPAEGKVSAPPEEPKPCPECGAVGTWRALPPVDTQSLAIVLVMDREELDRRIATVRELARSRAWRTVDLLDDARITAAQAATLAARAADFPGVLVRSEPWRETDPAIATIAGTTHVAWEEDVAALTKPERAAAGLHVYTLEEASRLLVGVTGLEARFDAQFQGVPGVIERPLTAPGAPRERPIVVRAPVDGTPFRTTLRRDVQKVASDVIRGVPATCAAAVVIDLSDGSVVAVADKSDDAYSHAITPLIPGSVFKLVTALAWLSSGGSPDATLDCAKTGTTVHGRRYRCEGTHPGIALREAFGDSCNCYFMTRAEDAGAAAMGDAYSRLGMDVNPKLGIGRAASIALVRDFSLHTAQLGIGQAEALATPIQVATAYARLATRGRRIVPFIDRDAGPPPESREVDPVIAQYADTLLAGARMTVLTGTAHRISGLVAIEAAGKSGTAEVELREVDPVTKKPRRTNNAWMVAFAPASAPRYVAVVVHERVSVHGATGAGPDVATLLEAALRER